MDEHNIYVNKPMFKQMEKLMVKIGRFKDILIDYKILAFKALVIMA